MDIRTSCLTARVVPGLARESLLLGLFALVFGTSGGCAEQTNTRASPRVEDSRSRPLLPSEESAELGDYGQGPAVGDSHVWLQPSDGATAVGSADLALTIRAAEGAVAAAAVGEILASAILRDQLGSRVEFSAEEERVDVRPELVYVRLRPTLPLADGWYMLEVGALPTGFTAPPFVANATNSNADLASEFRVGSEPLLLSVRWCRAAGRESMVLDFSEPLDVRAISFGSASVPEVSGCELLIPTERSAEAPETQLAYRCPVDDSPSDRSVSVGADVVAVSGFPVGIRGTSARLRTVRWDDMIPWGSGCRIEQM